MMESASSKMPAIAAQLEQIYLDGLKKPHWWLLGRSVAAPYIPEQLDQILPPSRRDQTLASKVGYWLLVPSPLLIVILIYVFFGWQPAACLVLAVGYVVFRGLDHGRKSRLLRERLESSDVLFRLVDGDPGIRSIVDNTPLPWRYMFIGYLPNTLRGNALLVAYNLDWYLGAQGLRFRWVWIEQILLPILLVIPITGLISSSFNAYLFVLIFYAFFVSELVDGFQRQTTLKALIQQLRLRFDGNTTSESTEDQEN